MSSENNKIIQRINAIEDLRNFGTVDMELVKNHPRFLDFLVRYYKQDLPQKVVDLHRLQTL